MLRCPFNRSWRVGTLVFFAVAGAFGFRAAEQTNVPFSNQTLTDILPSATDPSKLLVSSQEEIYLQKSDKEWKRISCASGKSRLIRRLIPHPQGSDRAFVVADDGVFDCDLKNGKSQFIFRENFSRNRVLDMGLDSKNPELLYLGTERGLFLSGDGGKTWLRPFRWPETQRVEFVASIPTHPPTFLLGTGRELFFSKDEGETFESGFSLPLLPQEETAQEAFEEWEPISKLRFTSYTTSQDLSQIWVGTSEGVYESQDGGINWQRLPDTGLQNHSVVDILFSDRSKTLIAATPHEIAKYLPSERRWETLSARLNGSPAALALVNGGKEEVLLVAAGKEVTRWAIPLIESPFPDSNFVPSPGRLDLFRRLMQLEPSVRKVQEAAIRYGDLGNGKIKRWQWGSRMRSFIPRVGFGKSFSSGNNVDLDRAGTNNPDVFIEGPWDQDKSWDVGLTWELGDLLYSTAQTSIDNRSKLLVELRESILGQVTRIYFERRRVEMELAFSDTKTPQDYYDLLFRLDELTAQLDALTDGFMTRETEKIRQTHPELGELWERAVF